MKYYVFEEKIECGVVIGYKTHIGKHYKTIILKMHYLYIAFWTIYYST